MATRKRRRKTAPAPIDWAHVTPIRFEAPDPARQHAWDQFWDAIYARAWERLRAERQAEAA